MMPRFWIERIDGPNAAEIASVASIEAECFGRGGLNEWHLPVIARQGRLYIAKEAEIPIGAASIVRSWDPSRAFLFDLVVDPRRRRRGVAASLMETIIRELGSEGLSCLELTLAPENRAAFGLYGGFGFKPVADLPDEYGPGRHRRLLRLDLWDAGEKRERARGNRS